MQAGFNRIASKIKNALASNKKLSAYSILPMMFYVKDSNGTSGWFDIPYIHQTFTKDINSNNQFNDPIGGSKRFLIAHPNDAPNYGEMNIICFGESPYFKLQYTNDQVFSDFAKQVDNFIKIISNEAIRVRHPILGYINIAISGNISISYTNAYPGGFAILTCNYVEVESKIFAVVPDKKISLRNKIAAAYKKVKDIIKKGFQIIDMGISALTDVANKLGVITQENMYYANKMAGLPYKIAPIFTPINRFFASITALERAYKTMLTTPSIIQDQIADVLTNVRITLGQVPKLRKDIPDSDKKALNAASAQVAGDDKPAQTYDPSVTSDIISDYENSKMYQEMIDNMVNGQTLAILASSYNLHTWNNDDIITAETLLLSTACTNIISSLEIFSQINFYSEEEYNETLVSIESVISQLMEKKISTGRDLLGITRYYQFKDENWTSDYEDLINSVYAIYLDLKAQTRDRLREIQTYQSMFLEINTPLNLLSYRLYSEDTTETVDRCYLLNKSFDKKMKIFNVNGVIRV